MGQTLSSAAQWTSAHEGGHKMLEFSAVNEFILKEIVQFVEEFAALKNGESTLVFDRPLSWVTGLEDSEFETNYHREGHDVVSNSIDDKGRPTLVVMPKGSATEVLVRSFEQLGLLIEIADCRRLLEAKICLEANQDPVANILGDRFATPGSADTAVYRLTEEIASVKQNLDSNEAASAAVKKATLGLLLRLKSLDSRLLRESIKIISDEIKLSPEDVNLEFANLKTLSGPSSDDHVLKELVWLPLYAGVNDAGCRAPLWRQLFGDISYILATPHDGHPIVITANTHGCFINGGLQQHSKDLDFEKHSDYYKNLMTLLRNKSPQFNKNIEKQDVFKAQENSQLAAETGVSGGPSATNVLQPPSGTEVSVTQGFTAGDGVNPPPPVPEGPTEILSLDDLKTEFQENQKNTGSNDQIPLQPASKKPKIDTEDDDSNEIAQIDDETKDVTMIQDNTRSQIASAASQLIEAVTLRDGAAFDPATDEWFKYPPGSHSNVERLQNTHGKMDNPEMNTSSSVQPPSEDQEEATVEEAHKGSSSGKAMFYGHIHMSVMESTRQTPSTWKSCVSASGDDLQKGTCGKECTFLIKTVGAEAGPLLVGISGPSKVKLEYGTVEEGFELSYTPLYAGRYVITIKHQNVHIPGSPFSTSITEPDSDRKPDEPVQEVTDVPAQKETNALSQEATDAPAEEETALATAVGNGLHQARLNEESTFVVNCSESGPGMLMVGIGRPNVPCERLSVLHVGSQNYIVTYQLSQPGTYDLLVKWGDKHINGSPFKLLAS